MVRVTASEREISERSKLELKTQIERSVAK